MKNNLNIATILPYKENYTFSKAQAAAIWVCDFFKFSKYKKNNYIFGSTNTKDYLTNNYKYPVKILRNLLKCNVYITTIQLRRTFHFDKYGCFFIDANSFDKTIS